MSNSVYQKQSNRPLVTVIIAVKDGERFLDKAVDSVLQQDYLPLEILVIDGHSVDKTAEIAQSYPQVRYIKQQNSGIADAYNTGIDAAHGDLLAFLSHDDLWLPQKLTIQIDYLQQHPEEPFCTAEVAFFLEPGYEIPAGFRKELLQGQHVAHIMETLVVRKSFFDLVGRFDPNLSTAEDVDWFARAKDKDFKPVAVPHMLVKKRVHDTNSSLVVENNRNLLSLLRQSVQRQKKYDGE